MILQSRNKHNNKTTCIIDVNKINYKEVINLIEPQ